MKLFRVADDYCRASNWKILALVKFCLFSVGIICGILLPRHRRSRGGVRCHLHSFDDQLFPLLGKRQNLSRAGKDSVMPKKLLLLVLTLTLAAGLCGCEKGLEPMQLQAAPVSEETRQVLDLIDNELTLWEYRLNDGAYTMVADLWVCQDGSWEKTNLLTGPAAGQAEFAMRLTASQAELIILEETGTTRYAIPCPVDVTSASGVCSYSSLTSGSTISSGAEIPLLARLGWDNSADPVPTDWQNFQDSGCDTGVAVTVTFTEAAEN